jgi:hypothetical protein
MFRYSFEKRQRGMGLGPADPEGRQGYGLADARRRADAVRALLLEKRDPLARREAEAARAASEAAAKRTFRDAAEALIREKQAEWSNDKHRTQWRSTLTAYAYPILGGHAGERNRPGGCEAGACPDLDGAGSSIWRKLIEPLSQQID